MTMTNQKNRKITSHRQRHSKDYWFYIRDRGRENASFIATIWQLLRSGQQKIIQSHNTRKILILKKRPSNAVCLQNPLCSALKEEQGKPILKVGSFSSLACF